MTTEYDVALYHSALFELSRASRAFASAITHAAEAAGRVESDDLITVRTFEECRGALLDAFARAPGMLQLLGSRGD